MAWWIVANGSKPIPQSLRRKQEEGYWESCIGLFAYHKSRWSPHSIPVQEARRLHLPWKQSQRWRRKHFLLKISLIALFCFYTNKIPNKIFFVFLSLVRLIMHQMPIKLSARFFLSRYKQLLYNLGWKDENKLLITR